jgi:sugar O-acyltransferase (sialic acid O-acetyltransferase NeuD family)
VRKIVLLGASGHASDVLGTIEAINALSPTYDVIGLLVDGEEDARRFAGRKATVIGDTGRLDDLDADYVVGIGYPMARRSAALRVAHTGRQAAVLVHPMAVVETGVRMGPGTVVFAGAVVSPGAVLGAHVLIGRNAVIGHDAVIGDFTSVMPAAVISGDTTIGAAVLIGTNATVLEGRTVGDGAEVGAAAVVTRDVSEGTTVIGVPARPVPASGPE